MRTSMPKLMLAASIAALALLATACGGGSTGASSAPQVGTSSGSSGAGGASGKTLTIGSANFTENTIIANMYADVLKDAGYTVNTKYSIGSREVYLKAIEAGEIDLIPEYVGTLAQVLNQTQNGPDANTANPVATGDAQKTIDNLQPLLDKAGLIIFGLSQAQDQNSYAVTAATAKKYNLKTLSDLKAAAPELTFGGPAECQTRPQCIQGLKSVYGAEFKDFKTLDAGGPLTIKALTDGNIDIGLVFSSDGAVAANNLVVLKDDKGLTPADNIIAMAKQDALEAKAKDLITKVNDALTTAALSQLNNQVGIDKANPADVANKFLTDKGLLS